MRSVWKWIKENPNRAMFLVPILLVAAISISHVVSFYDMANPHNWAIYLSIAIEVAAITALVAATNRVKGGIWFMFGIVTFIQMVGNVFYSYKEIDESGELFKSWIELTGPIWEMFGTEQTDIIGLKRWLAFLEGGLLPIISLTSLHFFVKYQKSEDDLIQANSEDKVEDKVEDKAEDKAEDKVEDKVEEVAKESFDAFVEKKKKKLEEDKKIFKPLLDILYMYGEVKKGDVLPTYVDFREKVDSNFTDDNIKMFLTLCNYLEITELSDNIRRAKISYDDSSNIMRKYLSLEDNASQKENPKENVEKNNDWWNNT